MMFIGAAIGVIGKKLLHEDIVGRNVSYGLSISFAGTSPKP
jgi:hypothetical protein